MNNNPLKVKFDWGNKQPSTGLVGTSRSEDKVLLEASSSKNTNPFGSGLSSAFTTTTASSAPNPTQVCCLTDEGVRCTRFIGNASYNKRIQKIVQQKRLRLSIDSNARHVYICDFHKNMIQSVRGPLPLPGPSTSGVSGKRKRKEHEDRDFMNDFDDHSDMAFPSSFFDDYDGRKEGMGIDMAALQVNTLRRYKKHFHVPNTKPSMNKQQLAEQCYKHLRQIAVNEKEAITYFIYMVKTSKNKLDRDPKGGSDQAGQ